eukprot:CAMPEP_0119571564 /NCGR_PEP_ID=MMETSP1352-20130426/44182_1 /TAXON_ID=265584 /ORGANISM="Stauroneis constricta, Strain CCMP1120" /LENGTH=102 /DNA_ID=CAMNT_0007621245 /DNA_START=484 /DNA_END=792 /DNA_ORIENTATION=+
MALSLLNYLFWKVEGAEIPFVIVDCVVVAGLLYVERGMKSETEEQEVKARQAVEQINKTNKEESRGLKTAQKYQVKQDKRTAKHHIPKTGRPKNIHQPSKHA